MLYEVDPDPDQDLPNIRDFTFAQNFAVTKIREHLFKIRQYYFIIPAQKHPNKAFLTPNLEIFCSCTKFAIR